MSLGVIYTIHCDGQTCNGAWVGEEYSAREARRIARLAGWKRDAGEQHGGRRNGGQDFCPKCAAAGATGEGRDHG